MRNGGIDFQRFARLENTPVFAKGRKRAHIVQAVGEFDNDNADVFAHGNEHLAKRFSLLVGKRFHLDLGDLGYAVNQFGNRIAKHFGHLLLGGNSVFHRVVQQGGNKRLHVHVKVGQDNGNLHGMDYECFARFTFLTSMHFLGKAEGLFQQNQFVFVQIGRSQALKRLEALLRVGADWRRSGRFDGWVNRRSH